MRGREGGRVRGSEGGREGVRDVVEMLGTSVLSIVQRLSLLQR